MRARTLLTALAVASLVAACAAPAQIVQISPGLHSLSVGALGSEGGEAAARNQAFLTACQYCVGQGNQLSVQDLGSKGPIEWGSAAGSATVPVYLMRFLPRDPGQKRGRGHRWVGFQIDPGQPQEAYSCASGDVA
jgi:hypothetical protein